MPGLTPMKPRARIEAEHLAAAEADPWKRVALDRKASGAYPLAAEKDAEPAAVSRLEAEQKAAGAAERRAPEASELAAAAGSATARPAAAETASLQRGPQQTWRRLFAATALALMAGIGTGFWLGKPPAVPVRPWPEDPGVAFWRRIHMRSAGIGRVGIAVNPELC